MRRLRLLLAILALIAVLAAAVVIGSPYASVMAPAPEVIEEIWAIEDSRRDNNPHHVPAAMATPKGILTASLFF